MIDNRNVFKEKSFFPAAYKLCSFLSLSWNSR